MAAGGPVTGVIPDFAPIARAAAEAVVECIAGVGPALLDGSASIDGNSTPGTNDDIVLFEWTREGLPLATGEVVTANLPLGTSTVTLTVTDRVGLSAETSFDVEVADRTSPELALEPAPISLNVLPLP